MQGANERLRRYIAETIAAIRADRIIYVVAAIYLLLGGAYVASGGHPVFGDYDVYATGCVVLCCVVLPYIVGMIGVLRVAFLAKGRRALLYRHMFAPARIGRLIAGTLLALVMLMLVEAMYTSVKTVFSSADFPYDRLAADIDHWLHFGHAPAHAFAALRHDWLLRIIEFNYDAVWAPLWIGMLYWAAVSPRARQMRTRFFLTFVLIWGVIGNFIAGLLPTAGPALYGLATGDTTRFTHLQAFLGSTPNTTAATQHYLWQAHEQGASVLGAGISAFPSMHVAVACMCALFVAEFGGVWRFIALGYTLIIMASSVYLGWHYAIDGYAAVILTTAIYWGVGKAVPWLERLRLRGPALQPVGAASRTSR